MSKALDTQTIVERQLKAAESKLLAISPVDDLTAKRALAVMMTLAKGVLAECDVTSVLLAALNVAKLGLNPDPQLGLVYIVPFAKKATVIMGYKGFIELGRRAGIGAIRLEPIHENDRVAYVTGLVVKLTHVPWWMREDERQAEPGAFRAGYVVANVYGDPQLAIYPVSKLDEARKRSPGAKHPDSSWNQHTDAMRLKTVIRRASKLWPQSAELARAVEIDERADEGVTQELPGDLQEIMDAEDIEEGTHGFGRLEMPEESKEDKPNA
jgi:recombination protein RecT